MFLETDTGIIMDVKKGKANTYSFSQSDQKALYALIHTSLPKNSTDAQDQDSQFHYPLRIILSAGNNST